MSRIMQMTGLVAMLSLSVALLACAGKSASDAKMKTYPETTAGLQGFMTDFSTAANGGSEKLAKEMQASLAIPDAKTFFSTNWEPDVAERVLEEYLALTPHEQMGAMLVAQKQKGRTEFIAEMFDDVANENATGYQDIALKHRSKKVAIYSFRATPPGKPTGQHVFNFVYVGGGWRLAGPMWAVEPAMKQDEKMHALAQLRAKDRAAFFNTGKLPGDE